MVYESKKIKGLDLGNRLVVSPMCMYQAEEGFANNFHLVHYGQFALGGAGLIMVEATAVNPQGRISPKCLGIWNEEQAEKLATIVDFIHRQSSAKIGIQLSHAGRKGSAWEGIQLQEDQGGWPVVAPSPIPYKPDEPAPAALKSEEIGQIIREFAEAAARAVKCGFDVVEIHAAHGYLLHQFLSPLSNQRQDEYGGSLENRCRFLRETVAAVRAEIPPEMPLFVRISADEYAENGWNLAQSVQLCRWLKEAGVDLIDVSSGGNIHGAKISVFAGYQVPFSEKIRQETGITTGAVGLITTISQAEEILAKEKADLIFMARQFLRDPHFALNHHPDAKEKAPYSYIRGYS